MKTPVSLVVARIGLIALGAFCSGCSLLGLAVDASQQPDTLAVDHGEKTLEGKIVLLTLRDGYRFAAECRRLDPLPGELYRSRYARWQKAAGKTVFPLSPGDTLHIAWDHGQIAVGSLEGFTRISIVVYPLRTATAIPPRQMHILSIPVEKIDSLWTLDGTAFDGRMLRGRLDEWRIPRTEAMLVSKAGTVVWVPLDEIVQLSEIRYSYHWFNTGAIADAACLLTVLVFFAVRGI